MSSSVLAGLDVFKELNLVQLPEISNDGIFHRIPGVSISKDKSNNSITTNVEHILTRNYSFVPGSEAYPVSLYQFLSIVLID